MPKIIQGNFSRYQFDTVALMKLSHVQSGQQVVTKGYYSKNDGGNAEYDVLTASEYSTQYAGTPLSTPNEFTSITMANGNIAVLQLEHGTIDAKKSGIVGDDTVDDTDALAAIVATELPLNFSNLDVTTTATISIASFYNVKWKGDNANIKYTGAGNVDYLLSIINARDINIDGFFFKGVAKVQRGVFISQQDASKSSLDVDIRNCKFSQFNEHTAGSSANAIFIQGKYRRSTLDNLYIEVVTSSEPSGAGTGITRGIEVTSFSGTFTEDTKITNCSINDVRGSTNADADGIVHVTNTSSYVKSSCIIENNSFSNCDRRSIKLQSWAGTVVGNYFTQTRESFTTSNSEISCQLGGFDVSGNTFEYDQGNYAPKEGIVKYSNASGQNSPCNVTGNLMLVRDAQVVPEAFFLSGGVSNNNQIQFSGNVIQAELAHFIYVRPNASASASISSVNNLLISYNTMDTVTTSFMRIGHSGSGFTTIDVPILSTNWLKGSSGFRDAFTFDTASDAVTNLVSINNDFQVNLNAGSSKRLIRGTSSFDPTLQLNNVVTIGRITDSSSASVHKVQVETSAGVVTDLITVNVTGDLKIEKRRSRRISNFSRRFNNKKTRHR